MRKVPCYVDGFNLYHAIHDLQKPWLNWLNLYSLAESLTYPNERLVSVEYFSAYATWRTRAYLRHQEYVKSLRHAGVKVTLAHFKLKHRKCCSCGNQWEDHEEKETDVRIALQLVEDAMDDLFDRAIIVSADSDLVPVVQTIRRRWPRKQILIATPPGRFKTSRDLRASANHCIELRAGRLAKHLLPETAKGENGGSLFSSARSVRATEAVNGPEIRPKWTAGVSPWFPPRQIRPVCHDSRVP